MQLVVLDVKAKVNYVLKEVHSSHDCTRYNKIEVAAMLSNTYAGSKPQTGPEDLLLSLGYFEYHSDGRH